MNELEYVVYGNVYDVAKIALRGKFIGINQ